MKKLHKHSNNKKIFLIGKFNHMKQNLKIQKDFINN